MSSEEIDIHENPSQEVEIHTKPIRKRWKSNQLLSLIALLISLGTFITFAYQNYLIREQQYRSVLPYLMINPFTGFDENGQPTYVLALFNNGVGLAFIEDLSIIYQGKEYSSVRSFYLDSIYPIKCGFTEINIGYALPAGQSITILDSNDSTAAQVLDNVFQNTQIEITYSSLYDQKWKVMFGNQNHKRPIKFD